MIPDELFARLSEGLDAAVTWHPVQLFGRSLRGHGPLVVVAAIAVCAGIALSTLRGLAVRVRGASDARSALRHAGARLRAFTVGGRLFAWGAVVDSATGRPLPFARIALCDRYHNEIAVAASDRHGVYGFRVPLEQARSAPHAASITASKDGYFAVRHPFTLHAGAMPDTLDIGLERR